MENGPCCCCSAPPSFFATIFLALRFSCFCNQFLSHSEGEGQVSELPKLHSLSTTHHPQTISSMEQIIRVFSEDLWYRTSHWCGHFTMSTSACSLLFPLSNTFPWQLQLSLWLFLSVFQHSWFNGNLQFLSKLQSIQKDRHYIPCQVRSLLVSEVYLP